MNMSFAKRVSLGIAALALPGVMAHAADGPAFFVGGGLIGALDSAKVVTHSTLGLNLTGGADFRVADGTYGFRPGIAINFLPGSAKDGFKTSLTGFQAYGDIVFNSGIKDLSLIGGLSIQRWYYKSTADASSGMTSDKGFIAGPKLGLRVGLEYRFDKNLTAELLFQQSDLGSQDGDTKGNVDASGNLVNGLNVLPAWIQVGVKYHF